MWVNAAPVPAAEPSTDSTTGSPASSVAPCWSVARRRTTSPYSGETSGEIATAAGDSWVPSDAGWAVPQLPPPRQERPFCTVAPPVVVGPLIESFCWTRDVVVHVPEVVARATRLSIWTAPGDCWFVFCVMLHVSLGCVPWKLQQPICDGPSCVRVTPGSDVSGFCVWFSSCVTV